MARYSLGKSAKRTGLAAPKKIRGFRAKRIGGNRNDELTKLSPFGGTYDEKLADGAAASIGKRFYAAQVPVDLSLGFEQTVIDRMVYPKTAVFVDGPQHELRPDTASRDVMKRFQLVGLGWRVVTIEWQDLRQDPEGTIAECFR